MQAIQVHPRRTFQRGELLNERFAYKVSEQDAKEYAVNYAWCPSEKVSGTCSCTSAPAMTFRRSFRPKPKQGNWVGPRRASPFPRSPQGFRHSNPRGPISVGLLQPPLSPRIAIKRSRVYRKSMYETMHACICASTLDSTLLTHSDRPDFIRNPCPTEDYTVVTRTRMQRNNRNSALPLTIARSSMLATTSAADLSNAAAECLQLIRLSAASIMNCNQL